MNKVTTREALQELESRGVKLTIWELRGMLMRNEIPKPRRNSSLQWDWTEADLQNVKDAACGKGATV
ncbi:MAG: hypothetical protein Tsb009_19260 [Planctomycetaceae bacterium]